MATSLTAPRADWAAAKEAALGPTRVGMGTIGFPVETTMATVWPGRRVPWSGVLLITSPAGTVMLAACVGVPALSPTYASNESAAPRVWPWRLGTRTGWGPSETVTATAPPSLSLPPA